MTNRIKIKFGQIEFEAEGDSELIERERQQFFSLLPQALNTVSATIPTTEPSRLIPDDIVQYDDIAALPTDTTKLASPAYESVAAFLREKSFKTDVERVIGIAYYIDQVENISPFNAKDIEKKFSEARQSKPSNINAFINKNITKSFLCESKEKKDGLKSFYISSSGIEWCQNYVPSGNTNNKTNKPKKSRVIIQSELLNIPLEELNLEKYPKIETLSSFKEKLLVVMLIYTQEKKIEFFSRNDLLSILKSKFLIPATLNQITGVIRRGGTMFDNKKENGLIFYKMLFGAIQEAKNIIEEI